MKIDEVSKTIPSIKEEKNYLFEIKPLEPVKNQKCIASQKPLLKERVTIAQKELLVNFIMENPEMVTHSSTQENEQQLWADLTVQLNNLKPVKSMDHWKKFWKRWSLSLESKPVSNLNVYETQIMNFLKILLKNDLQDNSSNRLNKKMKRGRRRMTMDQLNHSILSLDRQKSRLSLEIDENDIKILRYKNNVKNLEIENTEKRKRLACLNYRRKYLNQKKMDYELKNQSTQLEKYQHIEN